MTKIKCLFGYHKWSSRINDEANWYTLQICEMCQRFVRISGQYTDFVAPILGWTIGVLAINRKEAKGEGAYSAHNVYSYTPITTATRAR